MKEHRTPQKVYARSAENANRRLRDFSSNKSNKITKKSLNATFIPVPEDSSETSKDSENFAPISEISDADCDGEITETLSEEASSVNLLRSDMTPSENITDGKRSGSVNCFGAFELDSSKFASVEAEIAVNFLRKAQSEVLKSVSAAPQYSKLVDEVINFVLEEIKTLPEEKDCIAQVVSAKYRILFLGFLLWIIGVSAVIFFTSDIHCSFRGPLPT